MKTEMGDLYELGNHRLVCGDSTKKCNVDLCLNGNNPILMVTDIPYGVNYEPKWRKNLPSGTKSIGTVTNDHICNWSESYKLFPGDVAYIWGASLFVDEVAKNLVDCGFKKISLIIWNKHNFAISRGNYHWKHEICWYVVRKGKTHNWQGARDQCTVWDIKSFVNNRKHSEEKTDHSTQKPLECMSRPIQNNTKEGEGVYDPFLGSGTTLIAAEKLNRVCYGLEIEPAYCDMVVQRWCNLTGKKAKRNGVEVIN